MANGETSEDGGASPLWYALGAFILILLMMAGVASMRPLDFSAPPAKTCEGGPCTEAPASSEHPATTHEAPPASHEAAPSHAE